MTTSRVSTIVTAATTHDLIDLDTLKDDLAVTTTADNAFLQRAISRASAAIEQFCNRTFAVETVQDTWVSTSTGFPGTVRAPRGPMTLSRYPVVAITTLTEYGTPMIAGMDYTLDAPRGLVYRIDAGGQEMAWILPQTSVTYQAGFATIPLDVQDAVSRLIKARYAARARDPAVKSQSIPGIESLTFAVGGPQDGGNLPPDVMDALSSYRVVVTA